MKKIFILLIGLAVAVFANGQTIKVQGGISISKMNWEVPIGSVPTIFDKTFIGYSIYAGVDYLDKEYFNLSSNIGMIRKGGKDDEVYFYEKPDVFIGSINKLTLDYLSINTTFDVKYPIKEKVSPFISVGPRLDFVLKRSIIFDKMEELRNISVGLLLGAGVKYDISNFQIGLRADYYLDFIKPAKFFDTNDKLYGRISLNTFTVNLTVGYRIK